MICAWRLVHYLCSRISIQSLFFGSFELDLGIQSPIAWVPRGDPSARDYVGQSRSTGAAVTVPNLYKLNALRSGLMMPQITDVNQAPTDQVWIIFIAAA